MKHTDTDIGKQKLPEPREMKWDWEGSMHFRVTFKDGGTRIRFIYIVGEGQREDHLRGIITWTSFLRN